jgi:hypothetical protein
MPRPKHEKLKVAERRTQVVALRLQRKTQREIAAAVGVNQATVARDLQVMHADWVEQGKDDLKRYLNRELARIAVLERQY